MQDKDLIEDGNTLKYSGSIDDLPECKTCKESGEDEVTHEFLTKEHPYKLKDMVLPKKK